MAIQLTDDELDLVTGGGEWQIYSMEVDDDTKVSEIIARFPWMATVSSDFAQAATSKVTLGKAKSMLGLSDQDVQNIINYGMSLYNADGSSK